MSRSTDLRQSLLCLLGESPAGLSLAQLASALSVPEAEVEALVSDVSAHGVDLRGGPSGSLYLDGGPEWLDRGGIAKGLRGVAGMSADAIDVRFELDSTNARLMREAATRQGTARQRRRACLAEVQGAGRGRRGRTWISPVGRGLCLSVVEPLPISSDAAGPAGTSLASVASVAGVASVASVAGVSLAVGVAVAQALRGLGVDGVTLKWPNDVQWRGAKLAGILVESTTLPAPRAAGESRAGGPARVLIVGIGLNHALGAAFTVDQPCTDLERVCAVLEVRTPGRNELAAAILNHLGPTLDRFWRDGFAVFRPRFEALHVLSGEQVHVSGQGRAGRVVGVDDDGALLLETVMGVERVVSGEVSVRLQRQRRAEVLG